MLEILNWPTLEDRRKGARLKMLYKTLDKSVAMNFGADLQYNPQRPRRTVSKLPNERQLVRHFSRCDYSGRPNKGYATLTRPAIKMHEITLIKQLT